MAGGGDQTDMHLDVEGKQTLRETRDYMKRYLKAQAGSRPTFQSLQSGIPRFARNDTVVACHSEESAILNATTQCVWCFFSQS
jgi:hypothetical protein